jgi:hypothetical protein
MCCVGKINDLSFFLFLILYEKVEALSKKRYKVSGLFRHSHAILTFLIYQNESASRIHTCNSSSPGCLVSNFLKKILPSSFPDPGHFGTDPDPPSRSTRLWIWIWIRILRRNRTRILLFYSVAFKIPTKNRLFLSCLAYCRCICISLQR